MIHYLTIRIDIAWSLYQRRLLRKLGWVRRRWQ
jgi:hypothetical protein